MMKKIKIYFQKSLKSGRYLRAVRILTISYLIIFFICASVTWLYFNTTNTELKSFSLSLITNLIGIFITVLLIDNLIKAKEKEERKKILKNTFLQFKRPITKLMQMLVNMYKASCLVMPNDLTANYQELFSSENFYANIVYLDFLKKAPITPPTNWCNYSANEIMIIKNSLNSLLDKYAFLLDSKIIIGIEQIVNSSFFSILSLGPSILQSDVSQGFKRRNLNLIDEQYMTQSLKDLLLNVFELVEYFQKNVKELNGLTYDKGQWGENIAPKIGSGRVEL